MPPMFITSVIAAAIAGAAGFGLAWRLQTANILEIENHAKDTRIAAAAVARQAIERATTTVIKAQNDSARRTVVLRADADASRSALDGLRTSSDNAMRAAATSLDACNRVAAAQSVVLAAVAGFAQTVSTDADQCFSDKQLITEAWPR